MSMRAAGRFCRGVARDEQRHWLVAYKAYMEAMTKAGVLKNTIGLQPRATATTMRVRDDKPNVLDGPYTDSKEQLGGFHLIEAENLDEALAWAARSPTSLHGGVEVRPIMEGTWLTVDIEKFIKPE